MDRNNKNRKAHIEASKLHKGKHKVERFLLLHREDTKNNDQN